MRLQGIHFDDLDALADRFIAAGLEICPDDDFPGMRRFYCDDASGNRLEFLQPAGRADPGSPA